MVEETFTDIGSGNGNSACNCCDYRIGSIIDAAYYSGYCYSPCSQNY